MRRREKSREDAAGVLSAGTHEGEREKEKYMNIRSYSLVRQKISKSTENFCSNSKENK